jgi:hypothetical protein
MAHGEIQQLTDAVAELPQATKSLFREAVESGLEHETPIRSALEPPDTSEVPLFLKKGKPAIQGAPRPLDTVMPFEECKELLLRGIAVQLSVSISNGV